MPVRRWMDHVQEVERARSTTIRRVEARSWARTQPPSLIRSLRRVTQRQPNLRPSLALAAAAGSSGGGAFNRGGSSGGGAFQRPRLDPDELADMLAAQQLRVPLPEYGTQVLATQQPQRGAGLFRRALGAVTEAAGDVASFALDASNLDNQVTRAAVRGAMPALELGPQVVQGTFRQAYDALDVSGADLLSGRAGLRDLQVGPGSGTLGEGVADLANQTDLGQIIRQTGSDLSAGRLPNIDLGEGFIPDDDSAIVAQRKAAERRWGTIGGHSITVGRGLANTVFEPGTRPFNVLSGLADAGVAIFTPSGDFFIDGAIRGVRGAHEVAGVVNPLARGTISGKVTPDDYLDRMGGFSRGVYQSADPERAEQFFSSSLGGRMVDWLAGQTGDAGLREIWQRTNGKLDPDLVARLTDETDPTAIRQMLVGAVQEGMQPQLKGRYSYGWTRKTDAARIFGDVPPNVLDLEDASSSVRGIESFLGNVKASPELRDRAVAGMARAQSEVQRYEVYTDTLREVAADELVASRGLDKERARELSRFMDVSQYSADRASLHQMIAEGWGDDFSVFIDGLQLRVPGAHLLSETASAVPLPDARELRRATSWLAPLWESKASGLIDKPLQVLERANSLWKASMLMRGAYTMRVVFLEEQLRMTAAGYGSILSHPAAYLSLVWGDPRKAERLAREAGRLSTDALGKSFDESPLFRQALSRAGLDDTTPRGRRGDLGYVARDDQGFFDAHGPWAEELATVAADEVAQAVARASSIDEALELVKGTASPEALADSPVSLRDAIEAARREVRMLGGTDAARQAELESRILDLELVESSRFGEGSPVYDLAVEHFGAEKMERLGELAARYPTEEFPGSRMLRRLGRSADEFPSAAKVERQISQEGLREAQADVARARAEVDAWLERLDIASLEESVDGTPVPDAIRRRLIEAEENLVRLEEEVSRRQAAFRDAVGAEDAATVAETDELRRLADEVDDFLDEARLREETASASRAARGRNAPIDEVLADFGQVPPTAANVAAAPISRVPEEGVSYIERIAGPFEVQGSRFVPTGPFNQLRYRHLIDWTLAGRAGEGVTDAQRAAAEALQDAATAGITDVASDPKLAEAFDTLANGIYDWLRKGVYPAKPSGWNIRIVENLRALGVDVDDPRALREYLESVQKRVQYVTGGDEDLLTALRHGDSETLLATDLAAKADVAPPNVATRGRIPDERTALLDDGIRKAFELLASRPTDRFSRSPVFRQAYAREFIRLASLGDDAGALLDAGKAMGLSGEEMSMLRHSIQGRNPDTAKLTIEHIDEMAKRHGLDETRDLLYDLHRKSQFFETHKLLFPFGEAWKEVITTWSKLFTETPARITRQAAQAADAAQDSGVIYESPVTGELVFAFPGSEDLTRQFTGVEFPMEGRVAGLNIAGETLPGLGYVAQVPLAQLLDTGPLQETRWDWLRDLAFPFGEPENPRDLGSWLPSFARQLLRTTEYTPEEQRLFGNTTWAVARHLASTGEYELTGPNAEAEGRRLLQDAKDKARTLTFIRGMVQFGAPTSPSYVPNVMGPNGELVEQQVILDAYYLELERDPENALDNFLEKWGADNFLLLAGNTIATVHGGVPLKGEGFDWVRDNRWVAETHPEVYGFFAPRSVTNDFDHDAYKQAIESGELEVLSNEDKLTLAQHRIASHIYRRRKAEADEYAEETGDREEADRWLREQRLHLIETFPGYDRIDHIGSRRNIAKLIDGGVIDNVLADERFLATANPQVVEALQAYWDFRAEAITYATEVGEVSLSTSDQAGWRRAKGENGAALEARTWLREQGEALADRFPDFAELWDSFLSREFYRDEIEVEEEEPVAAPAPAPTYGGEEDEGEMSRFFGDDDEFEEEGE